MAETVGCMCILPASVASKQPCLATRDPQHVTLHAMSGHAAYTATGANAVLQGAHDHPYGRSTGCSVSLDWRGCKP